MLLHLAELMFFENYHELSHGLRCGYCKQRMETFCTTSPILHPQTSSISHIPFWVWSLIEPPDCNSISKPQKLERISICTDAYNIVIYIIIYIHIYTYIYIYTYAFLSGNSIRTDEPINQFVCQVAEEGEGTFLRQLLTREATTRVPQQPSQYVDFQWQNWQNRPWRSEQVH